MSINEMDSKIKELRELRRMADELAAEMEAIQDSIKAHMDTEGVDTINGTDWKVTYSFRCLRCGVKLLFKVHLIARFLFKLAVQFGYLVTQLAQFLLYFGRIQITRENHTAVSIRHLITPSPISTKSKWWSLLPG